jgi:hypothetical protein
MFGSSGTRTIAIISIGSGSVSVGIVDYVAGKPAAIAAAQRLTLPLEERTPQQTIAGLKQRLIEAGQKAAAAYTSAGAAPVISSVHAIIRAPWSQSRTVRVQAAYEHEEYVSEAAIKDLARSALDEARTPPANFLEASVMQVALNGYVTASLEKKRAHRVEVAALICACDPDLRAAVQGALESVFPAARLSVYAGTRSILEALRGSSLQKTRDCLVLGVSEEGTAAIVLRGGAVDAERYIPEGERSMLTRALPERPPEETLATMRMIAREECDPATCSSVEGALAKMEPDLAHVFGEFFAEMSTPRRLPGTIILIAHPDLAPWLARFFSRIDFTQFTETSQTFAVTEFKVPNASGGAAGGTTDIDLAVAFALINNEKARR